MHIKIAGPEHQTQGRHSYLLHTHRCSISIRVLSNGSFRKWYSFANGDFLLNPKSIHGQPKALEDQQSHTILYLCAFASSFRATVYMIGSGCTD